MKFKKKVIEVTAYQALQETIIKTTNGQLIASIGDWIVTGVNGEKYPCKPDIFAKTYIPIANGMYSKKPIVIEAEQVETEIEVQTLEGPRVAHIGDWIITGVNGEKYPCRNETFQKIYTLVE